ncbi:MAG: hypothetical protein KDD04_03350, partial [Sinomicrobium sp.]|nr:hypothetical protein [Sinomicrobium sp.]
TPPAETNSGGGGLWGSVTGALGTVRDTVRDGTVDIWNSVPGNEFVEDKAGDLIDRVPFGNVAEAAFRELAGQGTIALDADAIARVQADPAMQAYEANIVSNIEADPRYGNEAFTYEMSGGVEFGGQRAPGDMGDQFRDPLNPQYRDTWNVAGNELTWLLRHANVNAVAAVDANGAISITYSLYDVLDLRPGEGRSEEYNKVTEVLGTVWHDILGAEESEITATWTSER